MRTRTMILVLCLLLLAGGGLVFLVKPPSANSGPASTVSRIKADPFVQENLEKGKKPNRLIDEKSPYLLRHAFDPVDWNPWGEAAFQKARQAKKPIFLSIGYSSCFACYTMQRDVFENREIAEQMNATAVNILVDREERPDIDRLYMSVLQTTSGSGGWPMSLFLTPDRKPFFGATFLTAPIFRSLLTRVHDVWLHQPQKLADSGNLIASYLEEVAGNTSASADSHVLQKGYETYRQLYDAEFAGFGAAPKFPHPMILNFLLRYFQHTHEQAALDMTLKTLQQMASGALFDQVGYGFHRYSADDQWRTPHFEKMIYDQALLIICYLEAFQITHDSQYSLVATRTLDYVQREMLSPEGAFYGAEDAASGRDSTHSEDKEPGAFYVWTSTEIERILDSGDAPVFEYAFGIRPEGNTLRDPLNTLKNRNVIFRAHSEKETAGKFNRSEAEIHALLENGLKKLFVERQQRPRPSIDDKIILSWNALMISAFARASEVLEDRSYLNVAERCRVFLEDKLQDPRSGNLLRRYRNGEARYDATLQDYAFYVQALLDLYEASLDIKYLKKSVDVKNRMVDLFEDRKQGGFYDTIEEDRSLPARIREFYDDSEPAGNSVAILDLLRLSQMTGSESDRKLADRALHFFAERMMEQPEAMPQFLVALDFSLEKPGQIVIAGAAEDLLTQKLVREVWARYLPDKVVLLADGGPNQKWLSERLPFLAGMRMLQSKPTVYVCQNGVCRLPTSDPRVLASLLDNKSFDKSEK